MKKGSLLEIVVQLIQESLIKLPESLVKRNHKLIDNAGLEREFDIIISSEINGLEVCLAIECKDYSKKVDLEKLEAFNSKCNDVPRINKMVMVSRNGFQSGVIVKAKMYGIELLKLEELKELDFNRYLLPPTLIHIDQIAKDVSFKTSGSETFDVNLSLDFQIQIEGSEFSIKSFIKNFSDSYLPKPKLFINKKSVSNSEELDTKQISIEFTEATLIQGERRSSLFEMSFLLEHRITEIDTKVYFDSLNFFDSNNQITQSMTAVSDQDEVFSFIKEKDSNVVKIKYLSSKGSNKVVHLGNITFKK